jgi:hypothetical protein
VRRKIEQTLCCRWQSKRERRGGRKREERWREMPSLEMAFWFSPFAYVVFPFFPFFSPSPYSPLGI